MTTWTLGLLALAAVVGISCQKKSPSAGVDTTDAGALDTAWSIQIAPNLEGLTGHLEESAFAEQSLKEELDEIMSMPQAPPEWTAAMASLEKGECASAVKVFGAIAAAEPTHTYPMFLLTHARATCGDRAGAAELLRGHLDRIKDSSEDTLVTWYRLRQLGAAPSPEAAKEVLGVVVEIGSAGGTEALVVYQDGNSVYFTRHGAAFHGFTENVDFTGRVIAMATQLASATAPGRVPPGLKAGTVRFTLLTPGGPRVSEAMTREAKRAELEPLYVALAELKELNGYTDPDPP